MSIFATAKWDSDSDTPFDSYNDKMQAIQRNGVTDKVSSSKHKKKKELKRAVKPEVKKESMNGNKLPYDKQNTDRNKNGKIAKMNSGTSIDISCNSSSSNSKKVLCDNSKEKHRKRVADQKVLKKYNSDIKYPTLQSREPNTELVKEKKKQIFLQKKLDTALRKAALYKKLQEIQKASDDKKHLIGASERKDNKKNQKHRDKLREVLEEETKRRIAIPEKVLTLKQRMEEKLKAARFRFLNEQIYTTNSKEAQKIFQKDPDAFKAYHEGYKQQVKKWPLNPLDIVIRTIRKMPRSMVIADFGCGEANLSKSVPQKVYSFDLVAADDSVIACDMAHVPLDDNSVDLVVFCLSLMGTNLGDYLLEANRILKIGGTMKIVEVVSRFEDIDEFIKAVQNFRFKIMWKDLSQNFFYFMDFKKESNIKNRKNLPSFKLNVQPCAYKKR